MQDLVNEVHLLSLLRRLFCVFPTISVCSCILLPVLLPLLLVCSSSCLFPSFLLLYFFFSLCLIIPFFFFTLSARVRKRVEADFGMRRKRTEWGSRGTQSRNYSGWGEGVVSAWGVVRPLVTNACDTLHNAHTTCSCRK